MFLLGLFKFVLSLNLIHFYLLYYQDNNTEHHKVNFISIEIARFLRKNRKQNKQKYCYSLQLKGCAHYSLLVDPFKLLVGREISSRSIANVNS